MAAVLEPHCGCVAQAKSEEFGSYVYDAAVFGNAWEERVEPRIRIVVAPVLVRNPLQNVQYWYAINSCHRRRLVVVVHLLHIIVEVDARQGQAVFRDGHELFSPPDIPQVEQHAEGPKMYISYMAL